MPSGAKALDYFGAVAARLKSSPDTKRKAEAGPSAPLKNASLGMTIHSTRNVLRAWRRGSCDPRSQNRDLGHPFGGAGRKSRNANAGPSTRRRGDSLGMTLHWKVGTRRLSEVVGMVAEGGDCGR